VGNRILILWFGTLGYGFLFFLWKSFQSGKLDGNNILGCLLMFILAYIPITLSFLYEAKKGQKFLQKVFDGQIKEVT